MRIADETQSLKIKTFVRSHKNKSQILNGAKTFKSMQESDIDKERGLLSIEISGPKEPLPDINS